MGQVPAHEAGEIAYMLANGAEKLRGARTGGVREVRRWRLLFLSSGEIGLSEHMATAGRRARAGQEIRLLDIPADTGRHGVFEELHGHATGAALATAITRAARQSYGVPLRAYLERLLAMDREELGEWLAYRQEQFIREALPGGEPPSGQATRAAHRFAIIAAAGELAAQFGVVPWPDGSATWAARECFAAWLRARGGPGNQEPRDMLAQVRHFLELHGESRFTAWHCDKCAGSGRVVLGREKNLDGEWSDREAACNVCNGTGRPLQKTINKAGYRRHIPASDPGGPALHFVITPECWKADLCAGLDSKAVTALFLERNIFETDPKTPHKAQRKVRPPGEAPRWYYEVNFDAPGWEL